MTRKHAPDLTVEEVADALQVTPQTVRRHIHRGELEAYMIGTSGRFRITLAALDRFREAQTYRAPLSDNPLRSAG